MVTLLTVKSVLAVDLKLDAAAIDRCLQRAATERTWILSDLTEIPLPEALNIIEAAQDWLGRNL